MKEKLEAAALYFLDEAQTKLDGAKTEFEFQTAMGLAHTACKLAELSAALYSDTDEED